MNIIIAIVLVLGLVIVGRLAWVQIGWGPDLAAKARAQRARVYVEPARRGEIVDRNGLPLAFTMQARSLTVSPVVLRKELWDKHRLEMSVAGSLAGLSPEETEKRISTAVAATLVEMATEIPNIIEASTATNQDVSAEEILQKLQADTQYEVLVRNVDPDIAAEIAQKFHGVAADHQAIRQYPNGAIGENFLGKVSMDGQGQFGLEAFADSLLAGLDGRVTEDVSTNGQVIPGTMRDQIAAVDGARIELTIDLSLQAFVQQKIEQAKANSGAKNVEAVILDAQTAEVLAMANTDTIDPNGDIERQLARGKDFSNPTISNPFEPGSVAKIITAAAAIEEGVTSPDEVHQVPGKIDMAGVTVSDAWPHGVVPFTTTGIFGKSSNVGTLMLAQRLGEKKYDEYLTRFGIGAPTGIELPSESYGLRLPLEQWTGGTFANVPIGQGMSWTVLQMAGVYQSLANGGERIEPRIIKSITDSSGEEISRDEPRKTQVVSPGTAKTVVDMFRSVLQDDPSGLQRGTGANGAIPGYQLAGKTGTAQKVDEKTGTYSNSRYWITFAGIAPANDPRYVIAVMVDEPGRGVEQGGAGGQSAAPLFRDIASWLLDRDNVPLSPPMEGQLILEHG
nr:penicillin-binding protein 2 [Corynebacterium caspium]